MVSSLKSQRGGQQVGRSGIEKSESVQSIGGGQNIGDSGVIILDWIDRIL